MKRLPWKKIIALLGLGWLASSALVCWLLTRRVGPASEPAPAGWESVRLQTRDGLELGAWFHPGQPSQPVVVLVHGVRDSRTGQLPLLLRLQDQGFGVLALSLRGHGDSLGSPADYLGTRFDVLAAVEYLEGHTRNRKIVVLGRSLGAGAAIFASADLGDRVAGYFLEAPFRDLRTAIWNRVDNYLPPPLDRIAYLGLRLCSGAFLRNSVDEISPYECAVNISQNSGVVILAGDQDQRARLCEAKDVASQIPVAELVVIEGAEHLQAVDLAPRDYWEAFDGLVASVSTS